MANKLTLDPLQDGMRDLLSTFNKDGIEITNDTIHKSVLNEGNAKKLAFQKKLYKGGVDWIIWRNEGKEVKIPSDWMDLSVKAVAEFIMSKQPTE